MSWMDFEKAEARFDRALELKSELEKIRAEMARDGAAVSTELANCCADDPSDAYVEDLEKYHKLLNRHINELFGD